MFSLCNRFTDQLHPVAGNVFGLDLVNLMSDVAQITFLLRLLLETEIAKLGKNWVNSLY